MSCEAIKVVSDALYKVEDIVRGQNEVNECVRVLSVKMGNCMDLIVDSLEVITGCGRNPVLENVVCEQAERLIEIHNLYVDERNTLRGDDGLKRIDILVTDTPADKDFSYEITFI
jgi:hypothetical protein